MTVNDRSSNFKKAQRRDQRHSRSRTSLAHSSVQAQSASDASAQSVSTETTPRAQFDSALINGGHFIAAANASVDHRNVTVNLNIQAMEGATPQPQNSQQTTNASRTVLKPDPPGPVQRTERSNEIYERHFILKKRGHPLWIPQSDMTLPIPYRAQGVHVGDVGIFTENGGFDFFFNICVPRDDPINPRRLPENFTPISPPVDPTDIRKFAEFSPGSNLASSSVAESRTDPCESSDLIFESSASEGAILTMPEGAYSEDLSNFSRLRQYIATHAEDWYKFVNGPRGREAQNGDLRVVVGSDKTTSWGMATFSNSISSRETKFRLKFSALGEQQSQRNAGNKYIWEHSGVASAEVRTGPGRGENEELGETNSNRLRNQCLFLRSLNVTLSEKVWEEISPLPVAVADQNSHSEIQNQTTCSPYAINTGHSHPQPSESNSSQNLNLPSPSHNSTSSPISSLNDLVPHNPMSPFGGLCSHDVHLPCLSSMSLHEDKEQSFDSRPSTDCLADMSLQNVLENTPKMKCVAIDGEIQCDSTLTPDVISTYSSSCNSVLHPSKIISQYLLKHVPHARVAVTHDRDWSSMVSCHSDPSQLLSVVCSMTDIVLDNGLVFLELKEKNENGVSSEDAKVAGLVESIKDGRLRLDQYLFGSHDDRYLRLQDLCDMLRSGSTHQPIPMDSFLLAHPERPLSLDELLNVFEGGHLVHGSIHRESITSLRAKLSLLPTRHADQSSLFLRLGDALLRRFSQWAQKDDLEEAIWCYEEALLLIPNSHYYYLEALLGLCSSLYQRYYLLGHADDLKNLLLHLDLQFDVFNRQRSLLAPVEVQLCRPSPVLDVISMAQSRPFQLLLDPGLTFFTQLLAKLVCLMPTQCPCHIFYHDILNQILNFYWIYTAQTKQLEVCSPPWRNVCPLPRFCRFGYPFYPQYQSA